MDIIPPRGSGNNGAAPVQPAPPPADYPFQINRPGDSDKSDKFRPILSFVGLLLTAFAIAFMLNAFVIQSYQVDGESMETTLQNDDRLIVDKVPRTWSRITGHQYVPKRGTIIIFNEDSLPGFVGPKQLIKRVVGLPGDHIVIKDSKVTIYNAAHPEGFDPDHSGIYSFKPLSIPSGISVDQTLGKDEIFVCGDNRGNSEDSRYFGPVNTNQIVAKLVLRIMPLNKTKTF